MWSEAITKRDFESFNPKPADTENTVVQNIASLDQSMDLKVNGANVEELVEEHYKELSTEKLQELQKKQQQNVAKEIFR